MSSELDNLIWQFLDEELEEEAIRSLDEHLRDSPNRARFLEISKTHFAVKCQLSLSREDESATESYASVHRQLLKPKLGSPTSLSRTKSRPDRLARRVLSHALVKPALAAAFAVTGVAAWLAVAWTTQKSEPIATVLDQPSGEGSRTSAEQVLERDRSTLDRPLVKPLAERVYAARIVSVSEDARWAPKEGNEDFLLRLSSGDSLDLIDGLAKLEFASGAIVELHGPASLEITGPGEAILSRGRLTGRSEEASFRVLTPTAQVTDVGTAFGVIVSDDLATSVYVFEGEVDVQPDPTAERRVRLTTGMMVRTVEDGMEAPRPFAVDDLESAAWERPDAFKGQRPGSLGPCEISLIDIVCGSHPGEYRSAGSIDPSSGTWSSLPWSERKGVRERIATDAVVPVPQNPWVDCVFVPQRGAGQTSIDLARGVVSLPEISGGAWGPIWARRKLDARLDPLATHLDERGEGFWGAGTTTALLDRLRWTSDGLVGMHANVGFTVNLQAVRNAYGVPSKFRGGLAHLEPSRVSRPFHPQARATFQVFVDGELRFERANFNRQKGDATFGALLSADDRFLTVVVTDGGDGPIYDRVVLLDPLIEIDTESSNELAEQ